MKKVTQGEEMVAKLTFEGLPTGEIARKINLAESSVRKRRSRFYAKTGTTMATLHEYFNKGKNPVSELYAKMQQKREKDGF